MCDPCTRAALRAAKALAKSSAARCIQPDAEFPWLPMSADGQIVRTKTSWDPLRDIERRELERFIRDLERAIGPNVATIRDLISTYRGPTSALLPQIMRIAGEMGEPVIEQIEAIAMPYAQLMADAGAQAAISSLPKDVMQLEQMVRFTGDGDIFANPFAVQSARNAASRMAESVWGSISERTASAIAEGIERGDPLRDISERLEDFGFSRSRAEMIARTESAYAYTEGQIEAWKQTGVVVGKRWVLSPDACEFCEAASDEYGSSPIALDESFYDKGDSLEGSSQGLMGFSYRSIDGPPLHPNCRCALVAEIDSRFLQ